MQPQPQEYKRAKQAFFKWTAKWSGDENIEDVGIPDVPEIITLLQAIGFKVLFSDCTNPMESSLASIDSTSNPVDGVKINVLCTKSGLRACLQAPSECRCPGEENTSFWEVTGNAPNSQHVIKESGCDATYPVSKGDQYVIRQVLNHLFNMIVLSPRDQNQNDRTPSKPSLSFTSAPNDSFTSCSSINAKVHETSATASEGNIKVENASVSSMPLLSVETVVSPTRCRSLDTLTTGDTEIPKPGELRKDDSVQKDSLGIVHSSPNISSMSKPSGTSSPNTSGYLEKTVFRKVQMASDLLQDVLTMMQADKSGISIDDISKLKVSCESLQSVTSEKPIKKRLSLLSKLRNSTSKASSGPSSKKVDSPKTKPTGRPQCRPSIRSTSSVSSISSVPLSAKKAESAKKDTYINFKRRSLNENIEHALKDLPPMRKKNIFANVKSTIPKPDYKKK